MPLNIQITDQLVQAVRDAVDIVDVASEHTRLQKAGRRYKGLCPLHKEKTPSFSVDPEQGLFYCFGCGQGGDAIGLHMQLTGDDFPAAIESLARRYGIPLPSVRAGRAGGRDREPDVGRALEAADGFFRRQLDRSPDTLAYLERRRIPRPLIERYGLGYAPAEWRALVGELQPAIPMPALEAAGLVARSEKRPDDPYDRFRHRLMFPIRNAAGRLVGFGGRALGDDPAKYINTAETARFHKGSLLYGLDLAKRAIREGGRVFLVEGYFDVLGAAAAGIDWAVASMGTALTPEQCRLLKRFSEEVVVGYDGDVAGEQAHRRALPRLLAEGLTVRRPALGADHDPDSLRLEEGPERLLELVEEAPDGVTAELERLTPPEVRRDPRLQARAARETIELLRPIGDPILRHGYARLAADRLDVPLDLLWKRLGGKERAGSSGAAGERQGGLVRSLEERLLELLLAGVAELPPAAELPEEEAFLDAECRNIYRVFFALYKDGGGRRPDPRQVLSSLGAGGRAVDRLARLLLQGPAAPGEGELEQSIARLQRRWRRQRLRELSTEIQQAQRVGDRGRLERLLEEKTALSRALHLPPASDGGEGWN